MKRRLKEPFGKAGMIVAIVALIAALGGGAYAASGGLSGKQKKEVEKISKKFAGKPGANGANGSNGAPGAKGDKGDPGTNGANGQNVTVTSEAAGANCADAGQKLVSASGTSYVCNGTTGFTKTLPPGETETGTWAFGLLTAGATPPTPQERYRVPISFAIPLAEGLEASQVHYLNLAGKEITSLFPSEEITSTACLGKAEEPSAEPGNLCVYTGSNAGGGLASSANDDIVAPGGSELLSTSTAGAVMRFSLEEPEAAASGTWAVTAEE